jgi:hypothetical protein
MGRYSMSGLEMYGSDLGAFMDAEALKTSLMAGGAGAVGILATNYVLGMLPSMSDTPETNSRLKSAIAIAIGVFGGRALDQYYSRDVAMGFVGGVAGAGMASLIAGFLPMRDDGTPYVSASLSGGGLGDMDLAALEATVASNEGAWRAPAALSSPNVAEQELRSTMTSSEEIAAY